MTIYRRRPVVVGYDGSRHAGQALYYAAELAFARWVPLRVVIVTDKPGGDPSAGIRTWLATGYPALPFDIALAIGSPATVLTAESHRAAITVVGTRDHGGLGAALLGSVSGHVATHGSGPIVVVRGQPREYGDRPILVGVDGGDADHRVLAFAMEEAALRRVPVHATLVWEHSPITELGELAPPGYRPDEVAALATAELDTALASWRKRYPQVPIVPTLRHSTHPLRSLVTESANVDLVVVGTRWHDAWRGLLHGSIAYGLIHHAHCPVAVVQPQASEPALRQPQAAPALAAA